MTPVEAAWVAGIIEGEGSFKFSDNKASITVAMTDFDTIERLQSWTGMGTISAAKLRKGCKPIWSWTVCSKLEFVALSGAIEPFLMARRAARLREVRALFDMRREEVAAKLAAKFVAGKGLCRNGHDKAVTGVHKQGNCAECARQASAKFRMKVEA